MEQFPFPIQKLLYEFVFGHKPIAYLEVDFDGRLIDQDGAIDVFGLEALEKYEMVEEHYDFLAGLMARGQLPIELAFIEMPSGVSTDVYLFEEDNSIWILLIGAEERFVQQQGVQQRVNDLRLTHQRQSRILNQYLGKEVAQRLEIGIENIEQNGERRNLTVMFADIRGFTSFSEKSQPEDVFESLNTYLGAMIPAVIEENGVIDKIIGDEVMAIFGMLPEHSDGAACGLRAAIRMLRAIEGLNRERREQGGELLQIGIGMATGPVSLGVLGSQHRKSITVIGNHVNLAARLQGAAGPNQLIVDATTFDEFGDWQENFNHRSIDLKGFSSAVEAYQLDLERVELLDDTPAQRQFHA